MSIQMALSISGININSRGSKTAVVLRDNERFAHMFEEQVECLFNPGSYDKDDQALRQNIVFRLNDELEKICTDLDAWAVEYIAENSERLLGKALTKEQVGFAYVSNAKKQEGKSPLVKFKINMPGSNKPTRCWTEDGAPAGFMQVWAGAAMKIKVLVSHLWVMGSASKAEFGFVIVVTDVMAQQDEVECPIRAFRCVGVRIPA